MHRTLRKAAGLTLGACLLAAPVASAGAVLPAGVSLRDSGEGVLLADAHGEALYRLDIDGERARARLAEAGPMCGEACLRLWPPFAPPAGFKAAGDWTVVKRPDGAEQVAYKGAPLYRYADGDDFTAAGRLEVYPSALSTYSATPVLMVDGVPVVTRYWHAVAFVPPEPAYLGPAGTRLKWMKDAYVITDGRGQPLYSSKSSICALGCPPGVTPFEAPLAAASVGLWRVAERQDGSRQWTLRGEAVYALAAEPGAAYPSWRRLEIKAAGAPGRSGAKVSK